MNVQTKSFLIFSAFAFVILLIFSIIVELHNIKLTKSKNKLVKKSKFILENKTIIEKRMNHKTKELKKIKWLAIISLILLIVCIILSFFLSPIFIPIVMGILFCIVFTRNLVLYNSLNESKFVEIVRETLSNYDKNLTYLPNNGFTEYEYKLCLFPEECDRFFSEDMIVNVNKRFCHSDILVESEHEDDDNTYYATEYQGSLARMDMKDIGCKIFLGGTKGNYLYRNDNFINIDFENDEFNKLFRACADNELLAYKILTPDVMEEFVKIKKNTYGDIDIRLINDSIYIRFLSGNNFDSNMFNAKVEKRELLQSIAVLEEVMKTMDKVKSIIENKMN